jgi:hypothetical protein
MGQSLFTPLFGEMERSFFSSLSLRKRGTAVYPECHSAVGVETGNGIMIAQILIQIQADALTMINIFIDAAFM